MSASPSGQMPAEPPLAQAPNPGTRQHRARLGCLILVTILVFGDLFLSLLLSGDGLFLGQPLPPFGAVTHPSQGAWIDGLLERDGTDIGRFDRELGWDWIPASQSDDGRFHINSEGARGPREYTPLPAPDVLRIVSFGDSFTFGDEIEDAKTFQAQLENRRDKLEVMNFGVGGYGTDQALLRYRRMGAGRGARVVLIGIMLENIGRNVNRYRPLWTPSSGFAATKPRFKLEHNVLTLVPQPFADRSALHGAIRAGSLLDLIEEDEYWLDVPHIPSGRVSSLARLLGLLGAHWARSPQRLWRATEDEPFRVSVEILAQFHREALADGAEAAPILLFPAESDLLALRSDGAPYWQGLLDELERRRIPIIDCSLALSAAQDRIDSGDWEAGLYWGAHLSGAGNFVVAELLDAWLMEHDFLPSH